MGETLIERTAHTGIFAAARRGRRGHGHSAHGLLGRGRVLQKQTTRPVAHCVAAAVVEICNSGKGGKKLPDWWRAEADD